jgi:GNAT superfamily N-acetyltransferase
MKFVVGWDFEDFRRYYKSLEDLHIYFKTLGLKDVKFGELGSIEEGIIRKDSSHLIVWLENDEIIGHVIWHETSTDEHREGDPRDKEDKAILRRFLGEKKNLVELHEIWLRTRHRGKGHGTKFFRFFEEFIKNRGFDSIVYYANHPAALAICRKRGYKEDYLKSEKEYVFCLPLMNTSTTNTKTSSTSHKN